MTATIWKSVLMNMHKPSAQLNLCEEHSIFQCWRTQPAHGLHTMKQNDTYSSREYETGQRYNFSSTWSTILHSQIILTSRGTQIDHLKCNMHLVQNVLEMSVTGAHLLTERPAFEVLHTEHWWGAGTKVVFLHKPCKGKHLNRSSMHIKMRKFLEACCTF
jgi:hypothetical protein